MPLKDGATRSAVATGERLAALEKGLEAAADTIEQLAESNRNEIRGITDALRQIERNQQELAHIVAEKFERVGRPNFAAMASWSGVIVALIALITTLGVREIDDIKSDHREHVSATAPAMLEFKQLQTEVVQNKTHVESQIFALSARTNMFRDEYNRLIVILAQKMGTEMPLPTYYPPEFGSDVLK